MIFNVAIDGLVGAVPLLGDLFDFAWKSNLMNLALIERHALEARPVSVGDWLFVIAMIMLLIVIAALPFVLIGFLFAGLRRVF
jgi:hypothetical protein